MKSFIKTAAAGAFLVAANFAFAGEPVALNGDDLDQVNAGAMITIVSQSAGMAAGFLPTSTSLSTHNLLGTIYTSAAGSTANAVFGNVATNASSGIVVNW